MRRIRPWLLCFAIVFLSPPVWADPGALLAQGEAAFAESRFPQALVAWSKALREARAAQDPGLEATALLDLGRVHRALRRHVDARRLWDEALAAAKPSRDPVLQGRIQVQSGLHAREMGRQRDAEKALRSAFELFKGAGQATLAADALLDLGLVARETGRPTVAVENLENALRLYVAAKRTDGEADTRLALGPSYAALGRLRDARDTLRRAIELGAARGVEGDEVRGAALVNLSHVEIRLGDPQGAQALLIQARPLLHRPADRAALDDSLAALLLQAGRAEEALSMWEALARDAPPEDQARLRLNRALAVQRLGRTAEAEGALEEAQRAAAAQGDRATEARVLVALAEAALRRRDPRKAEAQARQATTVADGLGDVEIRIAARHAWGRATGGQAGLEALREAAALVEQGRAELEEADPAIARRYLEDRAALHRSLVDASLAVGDSAGALLWAERLRTMELRPSGPDADAEEAEHRERTARAASLEQALVAAEGDPERQASIRGELDHARAEFSEFVDRLRASYPDWERLVRVEPAEVEANIRRIGPDEAVLQALILPDKIVLLVYGQGSLVHQEVTVTAQEVGDRVNRALRVMRERRLERPERLLSHLDQLGAWLVAPVAAAIQGKKRLVIITDGPLRYLNAGMLRIDGHFLIEKHEILHASHLGALSQEGDAVRLRGDGLLALANPDGTLPAADLEADALIGLFPGSRALHGSAATREALLDPRSPQVLHLATHGVLDAVAPERSHLVLAPRDGAPGHLGYLEIPGLAPGLRNTALVVLSACESAVPLAPEGGTVGGTGLEIAGLANQFRRAGVPRLVASLWQVSDTSTRLLMTRFYEALGQGRDPVAALASAQRAVLGAAGTEHPFHWAAFVVQ